MKKKFFYLIVIFIILSVAFIIYHKNANSHSLVAIANYDPHALLNAVIGDFKEQMQGLALSFGLVPSNLKFFTGSILLIVLGLTEEGVLVNTLEVREPLIRCQNVN